MGWGRRLLLRHYACSYHRVVGTKGAIDESVLAGFHNAIESFTERLKRVSEQRMEHRMQHMVSTVKDNDVFSSPRRRQGGQTRWENTNNNVYDTRSSSTQHSSLRVLQDYAPRSTFASGDDRYIFQPVESFVFVLNAPRSNGELSVLRQLDDLVSLCVLLFGPSEKWKTSTLRLTGIERMIDEILLRGSNPVADLLGGAPFVSMSSQTQEQIDQLLAMLENDSSTLGSVLLVGNSLLHSRLNIEETYQIWHLVRLQPLVYQHMRVTPVYSENQWKNLVLYRMRWHTLCVLQAIDCALVDVVPKLERFDKHLNDRMAQLHVPIADSHPHLDEFAGLQTLAVAFHSVEKGRTLVPTLREDATQTQYQEVFLWFIQRAQAQMQELSIAQIQLCKAGYRFYAASENGYEIYLLCGNQCSAAEVEDEADRIVAHIRLTQTV